MNPMMAARAYAAVQGVAMPTAPAAQAPGVGDGGFADLVKNAMTDMAQQSKAAETQMASSIQGQGNLIDVVTALSSAEASLETVISVRDQVISAYKEIMAMPLQGGLVPLRAGDG